MGEKGRAEAEMAAAERVTAMAVAETVVAVRVREVVAREAKAAVPEERKGTSGDLARQPIPKTER